MKALVSPDEVFDWRYITHWQQEPGSFSPVYATIASCSRVVQIEEHIFDVAGPLFWVDCPAGISSLPAYKDGTLISLPVDAPMPITNVGEMP